MMAIYAIVGVMLWAFAAFTAGDPTHPRPRESAAFWAVLGLLFGLGNWLPARVSGLLVVALVILDGSGRVQASPPRPAHPPQLGGRVAIPILIIPAATLALSLVYRAAGWDLSQGALLGVSLGSLLGLLAARSITGCSWRQALDEGRRLNETIGAVSLLPQLLASLGVVFASAGVGRWIASGVLQVVPSDHLVGLVLANGLAMTALAALTGNSFAAFPVIAQGILGPLLIGPFHGDPAALGILTLAIGASGTLISPMAANFNLVPAALLELKDPLGVIRFQLPVAVALWIFLVGVMLVLLHYGT